MLPSMKNGLAVEALGLGDRLEQQVRDETDEARRKRMAQGGLQGFAVRDLLGGGFEGIGGLGAPGI